METPPPFEKDRYAPSPSEPEPKPDISGRKWYRFTLWKMVLAFVLLGFVFAYLRYTHWGYVLSENITRVGRSFGLVEQRDPNKIYVTAVRPLGKDNWEWMVELPRGELYSVCYKNGSVPVSGDPDEIDSHFSEVPLSYTYLIDFHMEYNRLHMEYIRWSPGIEIDIHLFDRHRVTPETMGWGWRATGNSDWMRRDIERFAIGPGDGQKSFDVGEKIVLLRQWPADSNPSDERGAIHDDGIMIWLEPAPPNGPWSNFLKRTAPTAGS